MQRAVWPGLMAATWLTLITPAPAGPFPEPIAIPFEPALDGASYIPEGETPSNRALGESVRAIVNDDGRIPVTSRRYPWSAMGRVDWVNSRGQTTGSCTGTLIGVDLVLTNAHCIIDEASDRSTTQTILFRPNLIRNRSEHQAQVIDVAYGDSPYTGQSADDWALLRLDQPLGEDYGYLGWRTLDLEDQDVLDQVAGNISIVGYAGDFPTESMVVFGEPGETAGLSEGCSILLVVPDGTFANTLIHDCDTNFGASGGPILAQFEDGEYYLVGLHSGSISLLESITLPTGEQTDILNRGVQVSRWSSQAVEWR
jgi:protease YdgD